MHEMVHCWQWNALGTVPSGLVEGIADFVRLKAGLSPPHWKKECGGDWDAGYQHTGYFLEWMESTWGEGSVRKINDALKESKYVEDEFWEELFGKNVGELWHEYSRTFGEEECSKRLGDGVQGKGRGEERSAEAAQVEDVKSSQITPNIERNDEVEDEDELIIVQL